MIKLFKTNVPVSIIILVLMSIVLSSSVFFQSNPITSAGLNWYLPFFELLNSYVIIKFVLSVLLISFNALMLNSVFNKSVIYQKTTALPALIYILLISVFKSYVLDIGLLVDTFLAFAFYILIELDQNKTAIHVSFQSGILIGLTFVFSFWFIPLGLILFFSINTFRPFVFKEWLNGFIGLFLPLLYLLCFNYIFTGKFTLESAPIFYNEIILSSLDLLIIGFTLILILISSVGLIRYFKNVTIIQRKQVNIIIQFLTISFLTFSYINMYKIGHYYLFITPLALLISVSIINVNKYRILEILVSLILIISVLRNFID